MTAALTTMLGITVAAASAQQAADAARICHLVGELQAKPQLQLTVQVQEVVQMPIVIQAGHAAPAKEAQKVPLPAALHSDHHTAVARVAIRPAVQARLAADEVAEPGTPEATRIASPKAAVPALAAAPAVAAAPAAAPAPAPAAAPAPAYNAEHQQCRRCQCSLVTKFLHEKLAADETTASWKQRALDAEADRLVSQLDSRVLMARSQLSEALASRDLTGHQLYFSRQDVARLGSRCQMLDSRLQQCHQQLESSQAEVGGLQRQLATQGRRLARQDQQMAQGAAGRLLKGAGVFLG